MHANSPLAMRSFRRAEHFHLWRMRRQRCSGHDCMQQLRCHSSAQEDDRSRRLKGNEEALCMDCCQSVGGLGRLWAHVVRADVRADVAWQPLLRAAQVLSGTG